MQDFLESIRQEHPEDKDVQAAVDEIEQELESRKYGLVWEHHEEAVDRQMRDQIPVFTECEDRKIHADPGGPCSFILEGDNLHSLRLLEKTIRGAVDMIYIDPPYNTENREFIYNDTMIGRDDVYRHSKWLSFMSERLQIAKNLLKDTGCIFISIDNNEYAQLKLLCDEIFGENNFIGTLIWRKKSGGGQTNEYFVTEHEYILGYRASEAFQWIDRCLPPDESSYRYEDEKGRFKIVRLEKWGSSAHREDRPTMYFPIQDPDATDCYPVAPDGRPGRWRVGRARMDSLIAEDGIYWTLKQGSWVPYEKKYFNSASSRGKLLKSRSILYNVAETGTATKTLTSIFGEKDVFQNPKPVELISYLMDHVKCDVVLDFFAGSGTTGHAVLKQNAADAGHRRFILCTNNENRICEKVTWERIRRVIEGYGDTPGIPANLKYYRTSFIPKDACNVRELLLDHITEMSQLEHEITSADDERKSAGTAGPAGNYQDNSESRPAADSAAAAESDIKDRADVGDAHAEKDSTEELLNRYFSSELDKR